MATSLAQLAGSHASSTDFWSAHKYQVDCQGLRCKSVKFGVENSEEGLVL